VCQGQTRPIMGGERMPEYPEYIDVPPAYVDGVQALVAAGVCEYSPRSEVVINTTPMKVSGFPVRKSTAKKA
jgi:hypothetical protein